MAAEETELDRLLDIAQEGIEVESFLATPTGKLVVTESRAESRTALAIILSATSDEAQVRKAVIELRIQHRMLDQITKTVARGRAAERALKFNEQPIQSYDLEDGEPV
jgi:hypothetical protein